MHTKHLSLDLLTSIIYFHMVGYSQDTSELGQSLSVGQCNHTGPINKGPIVACFKFNPQDILLSPTEAYSHNSITLAIAPAR